jgi:hypothetical protein
LNSEAVEQEERGNGAMAEGRERKMCTNMMNPWFMGNGRIKGVEMVNA